MIKCPNGCDVPADTLSHNCSKHERAIAEGKPFDCKIKNCKLEAIKRKE